MSVFCITSNPSKILKHKYWPHHVHNACCLPEYKCTIFSSWWVKSFVTWFIIHLHKQPQHLFPIVAPSISSGSALHVCTNVCVFMNRWQAEFDNTACASLGPCQARETLIHLIAWSSVFSAGRHYQYGWRGMNCVSFSEQNGGTISRRRGEGGLEGTVVQTDKKWGKIIQQSCQRCTHGWSGEEDVKCASSWVNLSCFGNNHI